MYMYIGSNYYNVTYNIRYDIADTMRSLNYFDD